MRTEKVSVIIPTYNGERYIGETINSVLAQNYLDYEIIIIDDGSTDSTKKIVFDFIRKYPEKIKYHYQKNKGIPGARNQGIKLAAGEYIAFLDHDDLYSSNFIFESLEYLKANELDFVIPKCIYRRMQHDDNTYSLERRQRNDLPKNSAELYSLLFKECVHDIRMVIKKSCFIKIGEFDENFLFVDDLDIWIRLAQVGFRGGSIPNELPLYIYRIHQNSYSAKIGYKFTGLMDLYKLYKKHKIKAFKADHRLREVYAFKLWNLGRDIYFLKKYKLFAFKLLLESQVCKINIHQLINSFSSVIKPKKLLNP